MISFIKVSRKHNLLICLVIRIILFRTLKWVESLTCWFDTISAESFLIFDFWFLIWPLKYSARKQDTWDNKYYCIITQMFSVFIATGNADLILLYPYNVKLLFFFFLFYYIFIWMNSQLINKLPTKSSSLLLLC